MICTSEKAKCSIAKPGTLEPYVSTLLELGTRVKTMSLTDTTMVKCLLLDHVAMNTNKGCSSHKCKGKEKSLLVYYSNIVVSMFVFGQVSGGLIK